MATCLNARVHIGRPSYHILRVVGEATRYNMRRQRSMASGIPMPSQTFFFNSVASEASGGVASTCDRSVANHTDQAAPAANSYTMFSFQSLWDEKTTERRAKPFDYEKPK